MYSVNVGFLNSNNKLDETQLDIQERNGCISEEYVEIMNLVLSLREEMDIKEIKYIDYIGEVDDDDWDEDEDYDD